MHPLYLLNYLRSSHKGGEVLIILTSGIKALVINLGLIHADRNCCTKDGHLKRSDLIDMESEDGRHIIKISMDL